MRVKKQTFLFVLALLMCATGAKAGWYPPLMIEKQAMYACIIANDRTAHIGTYVFDITVGREVSIGEGAVPLCWGSPGMYYDVIRITIWGNEDERAAGAWVKTIIKTKCDDVTTVNYYEICLPDGGFHRYTTGGIDEDVVRLSADGRHILVVLDVGTLSGSSSLDGEIAYTVETLEVFNNGHGKDETVWDSIDGESQQDPRCVGPTLPVEEKTWGAVKAIYE